MYYVTVRMYPEGGSVHPVGRRLAEEPAITRKAIHVIEELDDGTMALLTEVEGDLDRYREIMAASPEVYEYAVSGDDSGFCYSRVDSTPLTERLQARSQSEEFVVEMPIEFPEDGCMQVTMVGRESDFAGSSMPESMEVELVSAGPYRPDDADRFADLTDRQREVLETAIRQGYYENPRQATLEDVAAEVGVEPGTVGKHLRTVESKVFSRYVP